MRNPFWPRYKIQQHIHIIFNSNPADFDLILLQSPVININPADFAFVNRKVPSLTLIQLIWPKSTVININPDSSILIWAYNCLKHGRK